MTVKYGKAAEAWLVDNYGHGDIHDTLDAFEERFGWRPSPGGLYQKAYKLGLEKRRRSGERGKTVERTIRWSDETCAEYREWMLANDRGHSITAIVDAFEERFGIRLSRGQVSQFRARYGVGRRNSAGGRKRVPVGTVRDTGKGYIVVKVAERATVPMSKDNWKLLHRVVWEEAHGRPVPEGMEIMHADRDYRNNDPANLVAVEKRLVGIINGQALEYWDAESLQVAVARAELIARLRHVESGGERMCGVCGCRFTPEGAEARRNHPLQTCPACRAEGRKSSGPRDRTATCVVCGAEFTTRHRRQKRCPECLAANKWVPRSRRAS